VFQEEHSGKRSPDQEAVLIPGIQTTPLAAEDSLILAQMLLK
jgi:hypothetical protein